MFATTASSADNDARRTLLLATPVPTSSLMERSILEIYRHALEPLNYSLKLRRCEPMRCTLLANHDQVDGELMRYRSYGKLVPNMVRVEASPITMAWAAFTTVKELKLQNWQQVANSGLTIGYMAGIPYVAENLNQRVASSQLIKLRHWQEGLEKLRTEEINIYIGAESLVNKLLTLSENRHIHHAGVVGKIPLYTYLNKKHSDLATALSLKLEQMKIDGVFDLFRQPSSLKIPEKSHSVNKK
ncbi:MAG: transporter substrate-binding domain-containing protein [Immundisolibacteraceae bacterium]|nr:transporter substrate-binding domain-containing protein [Immundisolibacteraceae bacterium]